jgi:hypothetical protein
LPPQQTQQQQLRIGDVASCATDVQSVEQLTRDDTGQQRKAEFT